MILNLITDEKFTPFLQGLFLEAAPKESIFRVVSSNKEAKFSEDNQISERVDNAYLLSRKFGEDVRKASCVVFHSMVPKFAVAAMRVPRTVPVVWRGWGFDYYPYLVANEMDLFLPQTKSILGDMPRLEKWRALQSPKRILQSLMSKTIDPVAMKKFISRVDYFSCCVPDDFEALKKVLPKFPAEFLPLNYYSCEDVFLRGDSSDMVGPNILLGNSATPENNHVEIFSKLAEFDLQNRKVIVPLGYGDESYKNKILRVGEDLLGSSFVPLKGYVPLTEYNKLINSCGTVIMNHLRQQAIGNISASILRGCKVFLRVENPICKYYTRLGVKLFCYPDDLNLSVMDSELDPADLLSNKRIMMSLWSRHRGLEQVVNLLNIIEARHRPS